MQPDNFCPSQNTSDFAVRLVSPAVHCLPSLRNQMRKPNQTPCLGEHPCESDKSVSAETTSSVRRKSSSVVVDCRPTFSLRRCRKGAALLPASTATPNHKCVRTTGDLPVS